MRTIYITFWIFLFSILVFGQANSVLTGKVLLNGRPVEGASVETGTGNNFAHGKKAKTDANGDFRVEDVPAGTDSVRAFASLPDKPAKESYYEARTSISGTASTISNIVLELVPVSIESGFRLKELVTIAADAGQSVDEVSKTVNVISGQEMRERADITLVDSLRTIPAFRVQQLGGFGRTASIKTRGLRNQDTALLLDGIRLRDASAITGDASPFLSDLTLTSVSKVEVLRGSGSSLYGTNAIGGTIDFITPEPEPGPHGQISGAFGGLGMTRFRGNLTDAMNDGKFGYNIAVSRTAYTKGIDGEDNAHNTNFQSKLTYRPWSNSNFSGRFFISDAYVRLNSSPDTAGIPPASNLGIIDARPGVNFAFDANDADAFQRSKFFNGQFVYKQAIGNELVFQSYYSGLNTSRKNDDGLLDDGPFASESTSFFDGTIQTANAHVDWSRSINKLTAGYEFEHEKFGNDGRTPDGSGNFFTRAFQSSHTLYVQDLLSLFKDRLQLAGGFRWQRYSLDDPKFSLINPPYTNLTLEDPPAAYTFDGAASYFIAETQTKLRAHVGNGYRVPSLFERFGTFFNTFAFPDPRFEALGDPFLKPEKTIAFDGGVEQYLFNQKAKLTATYFYTKLIDTIGFGNVVPPIGTTQRPFGGYENQKGGIARGVEFSGTLRPTRSTDIFASYTFTNSDQRIEQISGSGVIETLGIPKHQFTLVATQRIKRFWASFDLLATDSYLVPIFSNTFPFNAYVYRFEGNRRADVTAGYTFPINGDKFNLRLFGTVENVFDHEYYENGFRTPQRHGRIGLSFGF